MSDKEVVGLFLVDSTSLRTTKGLRTFFRSNFFWERNVVGRVGYRRRELLRLGRWPAAKVRGEEEAFL